MGRQGTQVCQGEAACSSGSYYSSIRGGSEVGEGVRGQEAGLHRGSAWY